jgi:hypothetical protein
MEYFSMQIFHDDRSEDRVCGYNGLEKNLCDLCREEMVWTS